MEYHPLRTASDIRAYMSNNNIKVRAYAPLCRLVPALKNSEILKGIADKYHKSIGQIILRWHIQQNDVMPVFKTYTPRFAENIDIFDFQLTEDEMKLIFSLNQNYKYHVESVSCPYY